ncbi:tRNA pseudouridine(55) synthase TruB [Erythrobacter arachoides]|uniref:tRNA pseudouridine synthase B n=1 Tax=Aurantiacibacter arachoides TaxID=1850444 RepID=A0A844ZXE6_9SPHN|nr:tRNA pseudouridine(55) synthase TruB [Aurantiacibacter arachoides]MXO92565.1 tRNA pseudouridine(55) synthase TruB [Aurantiacibacter arachoides]GGD56219.1 tRNA pseudouridine synthase B [Aurantiacibacter arachoides]
MTDRPFRPNGWLILDKPPGLRSTQAVGAVKRVLRELGYGPKLRDLPKVGHGGTLDPLAEGVLPIALGEATKLTGRMLDADKTYEFTIAFGEETETLDTEGKVTERTDRRPPRAAIPAVLEHFTGTIDQLPPRYSALKVDGRRAYDLARGGQDFELATRRVTIHSLAMVGEAGYAPLYSAFASTGSRPDAEIGYEALEMADTVTLVASVSKGTYIRSLAWDIARALGTLGHVTYLRRTKAGPFTEDQAISLDLLNEIGKGARLEDHLLPLEAGLDGIPALALDPESAQAARQGRVVSGLPHPDGLHFAKLGDVPVALVEIEGGAMTVVRGFNI